MDREKVRVKEKKTDRETKETRKIEGKSKKNMRREEVNENRKMEIEEKE